MNNSEKIIPKDNDGQPLVKFVLSTLRPHGGIFTPFNVISVPIITLGIVLIVLRFVNGIGSITNLTQEVPWGLWIGFDVVTGVAFAGGAYVVTFMVYILNIQKYKPIVRVTVLNGFLAYVFYAGALLLDLGKPWNVVNPIIGNNFGVSSVLFLVAWHFLLYMVAQLIEFSPAIAEWLGARKGPENTLLDDPGSSDLWNYPVYPAPVGTRSTLPDGQGEDSSPLVLGIYPHPLFCIQYFCRSFHGHFRGIHQSKVFSDQISEKNHMAHDGIIHGLSKICAFTLMIYFFLQIVVFVHGKHWIYLNSRMGTWYLVEILGFVILPMILYFLSYRNRNITLVKISSLVTMVGVIINRLNVTVIAFKWDAPTHYVPSWQEIVVTLTVLSIEIWIFRWLVRRLPVLRESPSWVPGDDH